MPYSMIRHKVEVYVNPAHPRDRPPRARRDRVEHSRDGHRAGHVHPERDRHREMDEGVRADSESNRRAGAGSAAPVF